MSVVWVAASIIGAKDDSAAPIIARGNAHLRVPPGVKSEALECVQLAAAFAPASLPAGICAGVENARGRERF